MLPPLNIASPDYHNHIYDYYAQLRDRHPAYYDASRDIWMITRYEDVRALLRDSQRAKNDNTSHTYVSTLAGSDGELHDHLRGELIPQFSQAVAKTLELEPRHFGAMAGRVVIRLRQMKPALARQNLLEALKVNPWLREKALFPGIEAGI